MTDATEARHIVVHGLVQGVGYRPFVSRVAHRCNLSGWVRNSSGTVQIHVEGFPQDIDTFTGLLTAAAPPLSRPESIQQDAAQLRGCDGFVIRASTTGYDGEVHIPPDYFVCDDCLAEMQNPAERRFRYPFINCTQCGPRYTLIDRLPYDRPNTAMSDFALCPGCRTQYEDPLDRRYHAQALACGVCGPKLLFRQPGRPDTVGDEATLAACLAALRRGSIVAVKGVGGYHLLCDAQAEAGILRLRERKRRPNKPLAVLVPWQGRDGLFWVNALAEPHPAECAMLCSPSRPIVLVRKRPGSRLAAGVAPDLAEIGLMLPYSPLHHLLADGYGSPLVATSANISGEPVLTDAAEVERRLGQVADAFLHHDRPIRRPADDSVFRLVARRLRPLRMGRGLAPIERSLPFQLAAPFLAVGADLKNTVAFAFDDRVVISPHIGDLGSARSADVFSSVIRDLNALYGTEPEALIADAHPNYHSLRWAGDQGLPVHRIFHHHAHASALAGEFAIQTDLLVFTWDGTGYGQDGTIWGGEALLGRPGQWRRVGSLRAFRLPGGERASREPWRCAAALCWEAGLAWPRCPIDAGLLREACDRGLNSPVTSSAGRLFDGAAALIGLLADASYEGQAAMTLEAVSANTDEFVTLPLLRDGTHVWRTDWRPLLGVLMDDARSACDRGSIFHASLAAAIAATAGKIGAEHGVKRIGLCGGVFQNRLLTEMSLARLEQLGFEVLLPNEIPINDAGISFGQVIEFAAQARRAV
jgi:hydrogenase maturation protein HypF